MNPFSVILSVLLAFVIASPLCCCAAEVCGPETERSCCEKNSSGGSDEGDGGGPHVCSCKTKEPRDEAKTCGLPTKTEAPFIPVVEDLSFLFRAIEVILPPTSVQAAGCDPPRLLMARYSRWLI